MSGTIRLIVRKGKPKKQGLKYYPYWSWEIKGEDGATILFAPSWEDLKKSIKETIVHEMKVDKAINRNPDRQRYMAFLKEMVEMCSDLQTELRDFNLEEIYKNCLK